MRSICFSLCLLAFASATGPTWRWVNNSLETVDTGVAFTSAQVGYTGGDLNGVGPVVFRTVDAGATWERAGGTLLPVALVLSIAAADKNVVVSGVIGESWSNDGGARFLPATGGGVSQSIRHIGTGNDNANMFGAAGRFGGVEGVILSVDNGHSYKRFDAKLQSAARYAAFPTKDIWYVAAGQWPDSNPAPADSNDRRPPRARTSEYQNVNGRFPRSYAPQVRSSNGYKAEIARTTDGGKTWTSVFYKEDAFYFNGIDCSPSDPNHCCASGESSGSADAGAGIYCTKDGVNWEKKVWYSNQKGEGYSLLNIAFADDNEIHAIGGELLVVGPNGYFVRSTDGGETWQSEKPAGFLGCVGFGVDFVSPGVGYAAVDNVETQRGGVARYIPN